VSPVFTRPAPLWLLVVLAFLPLTGTTPAQARHQEGPLARAHRLMGEWRVEEAERELRGHTPARGHEAEAALVQGELRFLLGDYEAAARGLREALAQLRLPAAEAAEWRTLQELSTSTAEVTHGFEEALSPGGHFRLRYARGKDALLVPYAGEALERAWAALGADFAGVLEGESEAAQPRGPVRVEIYGDIADLARVSTLTLKEIETSGTIALCKWNRLMIVSPRALVRGYPWLDTLTHEYTHFIVSRVSRGTAPIWLHEGLAKFEERRWRGPPGGGMTPAMEHLLSAAMQKRRFITFEQMYPSMAKLPSQEDTALAFAEVYTFVEYLHGRGGWPGIHRLIREMASGAMQGRAVSQVMGSSLEELERGWKTWLKGRKLRGGRGAAGAARLKFRKGPPEAWAKGKKEGEEDDSGEVVDPRARGHARLGGMLREKGRLAAAALEYEKALAILGPGHVVVGSKLARTYLEMGEAERAIAVAEPVREQNPDLSGPNVTLGGAWLKKGNMSKAALYLEAAIRVNPFDPAVHCGLEQAYRQTGSRLVDLEERACKMLSGG
jgi:tetratricopeptide (TPR) repeat protein